MGAFKTTRRLVNNTGNVKCKTTKVIGRPKNRKEFNTNGCRNLKQMRNLNYTAAGATYRKSTKIVLPEIYESLGLVFPHDSSIIGKYSKSPGIVVMSGNLLYIIVGGGKLYIKLPLSVKGRVKSYLGNSKQRQNKLKQRAAGQRKTVGNVATGGGRAIATFISP